MAKALIGQFQRDHRTSRQALENQRLRNRVAELETLVLRLQGENDRLIARQSHVLAEQVLDSQMLPA